MSRKVILPFVILGLGFFGVALLWVTRPEAEATAVEVPAPVVRVVTIEFAPHQFQVATQGTVEPRWESELVSQVSGEVVWVSPSLVPGGFFETGEPLLRIDPTDLEADLESARAALARARSEDSRATKDRDRQRRLADQSVASQSRIDDAENAAQVAAAGLREAQARLGQAERSLARAELQAPYAGRVRSESIDLGQFVTRGQAVAKLYAVDFAEVRLPLPDRELRYLDVPLGYREHPAGGSATGGVESSSGEGGDAALETQGGPRAPRVRLNADFAGHPHEWIGEVVRTEGELDPKSRMVTVVARVADPYGRSVANERPPLAVGLFVEAQIDGRTVEEAVLLPRESLFGNGQVVVVDEDDRVRLRRVDILRTERDRIVVGAGLESGDRVAVTPLSAAVDGMKVRVLPENRS